LTPPDEKYRAFPAASLYLDAGASNAADVERLGVRIGDPCTYEFGWSELQDGRVSTTSLDDRLGVAALLVLIDRLIVQRPAGIVHFAFTTQEEFHVRGTLALVERYKPDIVVNVDISPATDTPDLNGQSGVHLGGGPVISRLSFHGRGTLGGLIPHPGLLAAAVASAEAACPNYQFEAIVGLITDAAFVPMATADGIATIGISIPVRYTHSPIETGQLSDLKHTVDLLHDLVVRARDIDLSRFTAV
jgi:putative aminopeptidase FrvX